MVEFIDDYLGFLARTLTVLVAILAVLLTLAAMRARHRDRGGQLQVRKLNDCYRALRERLESALMGKAQRKAQRKQEARLAKQAKKAGKRRPRVFVLDFHGDLKASAVEGLRQEITALIGLATPADEVVLRLESGGGMVHSYGLAASQLARIRQAGLPLTVCVDKVAASGGYMMACIGDKVLAAPFAILGSIGVVAQLPNVHRLLKKHDIEFEVLTAGEYKRTLSVFGENTPKGREKFQQDLEAIHQLFKDFVARHRPQLNIDEIATGEIWLGQAAYGKRLVDGLMTSDEYLCERAREADLFELHFVARKSLPERLGMAASVAADGVLGRWWNRLNEQRFG